MATEPQIDVGPATQPLVSAKVGDRCVSCGTAMSSDQRYCVACGERRGKPRFSIPMGGTAGAPAWSEPTTVGASVAPPPRAPRASSGTTIVAGVGTLLLAMGVGVLIGRSSAGNVNNRPVQAAAPTVVTVGGGAASTGTATAGAAKTSPTKSSRSKGVKGAKGKAHANTASKPTAAQAAKASNAASKVLGSSNKALPPATVTVGQTGKGPGYNKTGKFDGSFFGQ
jgi:hypothetical protein